MNGKETLEQKLKGIFHQWRLSVGDQSEPRLETQQKRDDFCADVVEYEIKTSP